MCVGGGGHLSQVPRLWGWSVRPPHLPFHFCFHCKCPCSPVVTKLIYNRCAPYPPPTRLREIKKSALGCCRAGPMLLGWGEWKSTKYRGTYAQFFLRCGLYPFFIQHFFLSNFKPPPPSPSHGLCCFSERWADSDLHCKLCAPFPNMGTLPKHQEDDNEMQN